MFRVVSDINEICSAWLGVRSDAHELTLKICLLLRIRKSVFGVDLVSNEILSEVNQREKKSFWQ
jgi:hypothetical protein